MPEPVKPGSPEEDPLDQIVEKTQAVAQSETAPGPVRRYRSLIFQAYVLSAIVAFSLLALLARTTAYFPIDVTITQALQAIDLLGLSWVMRLASWPGFNPQASLLILLAVLLLFMLGLRWEAVATGVSTLASGALNVLVKLLIQRPRPAADIVDVFRHLADFSFPSGHVMLYTGFYGFLWFLIYTLLKPSWKRTLLLLIFGGLVLLVGPSRVYLGQHWASDVLAGYLLSSLILAAAILFYRWGKSRFFVSQPVASEADNGTDD